MSSINKKTKKEVVKKVIKGKIEINIRNFVNFLSLISLEIVISLMPL